MAKKDKTVKKTTKQKVVPEKPVKKVVPVLPSHEGPADPKAREALGL